MFQLVSVLMLASSALAGEPLVQSIRISGTALQVKLATQVGQPFDTRTIDQDVRYLWSLGRFEDIRVEAAEAASGVAVVFRTMPRRLFAIHKVDIEPNPLGLKIALPEGSRVDRRRLEDVAVDLRKQLEDRGFLNARVTYELTPAVRDEVDLKLKPDPGDAVRVRTVAFMGETAVPPSELQRALHALKPRRLLPGVPHLWKGWRLLPSYTQSAVDADLSRLQSHYFFKGFFDAKVQATSVETAGTSARVTFEVHAGPQYGAVRPDFCSALFADRRTAERTGVLDFSPTVDVDLAGQLVKSTELGRRYQVGRIQFIGNRNYSDAVIRHNFVLDEGQPLDERRLRESIARVNRTKWFENINERSIAIMRNPDTGVADIRIRLTERERGSWSISGPVGPMSFAGPLQAAIGIRLPSWGRGILELSTYTASFSVFGLASPALPFLTGANNSLWFHVFSLQRQYTPGEGWRSGFAIAPQLGWRGMAAGYFATQVQERLIPILNGDRGLVPDLQVTVHRVAGDTVISCEPPKPKLGPLRSATAMALQTLGSLSGN